MLNKYERNQMALRIAHQKMKTASVLHFWLQMPWTMTLAEFKNPFPKPDAGYVSLYHYTSNPYLLKGISQRGLEGRGVVFAHQELDYVSKVEGKPLVHFQAPKREVDHEAQGGSVVPLHRNVGKEDILSTHYLWPSPLSVLTGKNFPGRGFRSDIGARSSEAEDIHSNYVEAAMLSGRDVPSRVLAQFPALRRDPKDPASYPYYRRFLGDDRIRAMLARL